MIVYIAGPITGDAGYRLKFSAAEKAIDGGIRRPSSSIRRNCRRAWTAPIIWRSACRCSCALTRPIWPRGASRR